jgi:hypothetical protein
MQRDLELELKENKANQERCNGKVICYGESVQLRHTMTTKYLAVSSSDTSLTENTKLRVRVQMLIISPVAIYFSVVMR